VLVFAASAIGLLDYNLVWVNPTYLWPGIVGGLIMGVGFIIGGFCPGTSLVSAATGRLDGLFFAIGAFFGIFVFGETVGSIEDFWYSSYEGRYTIPDFLNLSTGSVVVILVLFALAAFAFAEQMERIFGGSDLKKAPKWRYGAAGTLLASAFVVMWIGQPDTNDRWHDLEDEKAPLLADRSVQIHPGEVLTLMRDDRINLVLLDVRDESDYNLFHILDAANVPTHKIPSHLNDFRGKAANTVFVVMSNDEKAATEVWKTMVAESVLNVYILEGGLNNWITTFAEADFKTANALVTHKDDVLAYTFSSALGSRYPMANPNPDVFQLEYTPKVKLQGARGGKSGGCG
jgi:rhodanese-related sulfurtransferase